MSFDCRSLVAPFTHAVHRHGEIIGRTPHLSVAASACDTGSSSQPPFALLINPDRQLAVIYSYAPEILEQCRQHTGGQASFASRYSARFVMHRKGDLLDVTASIPFANEIPMESLDNQTLCVASAAFLSFDPAAINAIAFAPLLDESSVEAITLLNTLASLQQPPQQPGISFGGNN